MVVKPRDGNQGKGVAVNVETREQVFAAFAAASEIRDEVMVERYLPGNDFRLLVVGNKLVAAARRDPPQVVGDGVHSVRELVEQVNRDPRRGDGHATSLTKIRFDDIALARLAAQGYHADAMPPRGTRVILRNNANLSTGGTATDVTDDVHPEVAARAVTAAQMVGLDICGVDVVCNSVLRPLEEQGGGIVEVNAAPGLRMHLTPSYGKGRAVGEAIIARMFGRGRGRTHSRGGRHGTNGKTTTVRLIAHLLARQRAACRHDQFRWHLRRRQRIDTGRLQRTQERAQRAAASGRRRRRVRNRARRHAARGARLRPLRCRGGHEHRLGRPPRPELHHHRRGPRRGEAGRSSRTWRQTASRC